MAEGIVDERLMQRLAAQLRARDERERVARLSRAEAAIPPTEELITSGPVPLEFTPTPSLGPPGPGGIGPRQMLDPRFGDYPGIGSNQRHMMTKPMDTPEGLRERARNVRLGYASPASAESFYPAVAEARRRSVDSWVDEAPFRDYLDVRQQAWNYADPELAAYRERERLLEGPRAREAARQRRLEAMFGTPEDRAADILATEASRAQAPVGGPGGDAAAASRRQQQHQRLMDEVDRQRYLTSLRGR